MDENDSLKPSDANALVGQNRANLPLPDCTDAALTISRQIGAHFDHMRVDFISDGTSLWLGELAVYNLAGNFKDIGSHENEALKKAWDIRKSRFLTVPQTGWRKVYAAALLRRLNARST